MKVLFIGHYRDGNTGWATVSRDYIHAMDKAGIDIAIASVKLNDAVPELDDRILELEKKSIKGCDICIQHVLPHHLEYNGNFKKNIALCVYESENNISEWSTKINMMDELWTSSEFSKRCFESSGVTIPIRIIPHAFNLEQYSTTPEKIEHSLLDGNIVFYTIADLNQRKNLAALIRTFHIAFSVNMPVRLFIKTSRHGMHAEEVAAIVQDECRKIKQALKLYRRVEDYISELIIADNIDRKELMQLHATGDVYVCTSRGEAWCVPLFEASAMNKITIAPAKMFDYPIDYEARTYRTPVKGMNDTFFEVSSGREVWYDIDEIHLKELLLKAYDDAIEKRNKQKDLSKFSHENVGNLIKETLCLA